MGILNVTPDSFSDGGQYASLNRACAHARQMVAEGAAIIDVGGESTRPGAESVGLQEELDRVIPVIEVLHRELDVPISIDTSKPEVMRAALAVGAGLINDVYALRAEGAIAVVAASQAPVCLMHMQGEPRTMQANPHYENVVTEVQNFLSERKKACLAEGISEDRILLDPGFGFGKNLQHNLQLLNSLETLHSLNSPVLVGLSRKAMLGMLLNRSTEQRLAGSLTLAVLAASKGAHIIRSHDVRETVDALKVMQAVQQVTL